MDWQDFPPFTSSNIATIRSDDEQMVLEIVFNSGGTYQYFDVPSHVVDEFKAAESKGGFLAARIKGHYRYSKV